MLGKNLLTYFVSLLWLGVFLIFGNCVQTKKEEIPSGGAGNRIVGDTVMAIDDSIFEGLEKTTIRLAGQRINLTREDARAIGLALAAYLKASAPSLRDELLPWVEDLPGWIDNDGIVRIGPWILDARDDKLILVYRPAPTLETGFYRYVATVERVHERWLITGIDRERLLRPR